MIKDTFLWIVIILNIVDLGFRIWDLILRLKEDDDLAIECEE